MKITICFILILLLTSCLEKREPMQQESGIVIEKQYFPDTRHSVTGTGFDTRGNVIITSHQVGEHEKYIVIFKCQHGIVFSINKPDIYGKVNKGDKVRIDYYELVNRDGEVKDFDFVDANTVQ